MSRVHTIQSRTFEIRDRAMNALVALVGDIKAARQQGVGDERLAAAQNLQRRGQFLLDFVEAENSVGFHADQEAVRILALSLDYLRQGQLAAREAAQPQPTR